MKELSKDDGHMVICCLQAALPKAELRRSTRAATRAAQRQPLADHPHALPSQVPPPQTPEDTPTATPMPDSKHVAGPQGSQPATASDADPQSVQAGALQTSLEDTGALVQPPSTAQQAHAEGAAHAEHAASQDASAALAVGNPGTQLALTGKSCDVIIKRKGGGEPTGGGGGGPGGNRVLHCP